MTVQYTGYEFSHNLCTEQSPKESDDNRCCTNTICSPEDEYNSAQNMYRNKINDKCIKITNLCIKLVKKTIILLLSLSFFHLR